MENAIDNTPSIYTRRQKVKTLVLLRSQSQLEAGAVPNPAPQAGSVISPQPSSSPLKAPSSPPPPLMLVILMSHCH